MTAHFRPAAWLLLLGILSGCGAGGVVPPNSPGSLKASPNIAFIGDSITYRWNLPSANLGVSGDTTAQMRSRFAADVLRKGYKAVVILGGTNDVHELSGSLDAAVAGAVANLQWMAQDAASDRILVVLCEIPPIAGQDDRATQLNAAIEALAKAKGYRLVDYYTPMVGHPEYFLDGIHPNIDGYAVMQDALSKVLPIDY